MTDDTCKIERCDKAAKARGWCPMHYRRWRLHGDPHTVHRPTKPECSVEGCRRDHCAKGYCTKHYTRWKKTGDPGPAGALPQQTRRCDFEGCDRKHLARGWCAKHYRRWRHHGSPERQRQIYERCRVDECDREDINGHGLCEKHYRRWYRTGDPEDHGSRIVGDDEARFWSYVDQDGPVPEYAPELGPCWVWQSCLSPDGYAVMTIQGDQSNYVSRWSYQLHGGTIPEGYEIDHLCRVRHCVNPDHLEPVTHAENLRRAREAQAKGF